METKTIERLHTFLKGEVKPVNIGISSFYEGLTSQGLDALQLDWRPPALGNPELLRILDKLREPGIRKRIEKANDLAVKQMIAADPVLEDVAPAGEVISGLEKNMVLHAGPPMVWEEMPEAIRGSVIAAVMSEGWASSPNEAAGLAESGHIDFHPGHDFDHVGGFSGVITHSMPVFVVRNRDKGNIGFSSWRDIGQASGRYNDEVLRFMKWQRERGVPVLRTALKQRGGIELRPYLVQGIMMGDEHHNRVIGDTANFTRMFAYSIVEAAPERRTAVELLKYFADLDLASVPINIAAAKCIVDAAKEIEYSTIITAWGRNGVEDGIQISGLGNVWFNGLAPLVEGTYFPGFSQADSAPAIGDSCVIECSGFGGMASAAAPTHATVKDAPGAAEKITRDMYEITWSKNSRYPIPLLDSQGVPIGIDLLKVLDTGIRPVSNNPAVHKNNREISGVIGFGLTRPPMEAFEKALKAFEEKYLMLME
ncbi:MAG: DUF1116 domain-containing protein [candidate division Zixibacteria bacterium]|nr:DUF1116 domain-containing protein [candidate division Zixibacteria bacterium]